MGAAQPATIGALVAAGQAEALNACGEHVSRPMGAVLASPA